MEKVCQNCPRACKADRLQGEQGFCGAPHLFSVARASLHMWEEPSVSGTKGSGTIFFTGCNLRCVFCQNREISRGGKENLLTDEELSAVMLRLRDAGAHNINLVTPTPYAHRLADLLPRVKPLLGIPIVYNCGGYESVEALRKLEGLVDIYLPDFKYLSSDVAEAFSSAPDYLPVATAALKEMVRQTGAPQLSKNGLLEKGTIVRHLVLPGHRGDSLAVLRHLAEEFGTKSFLLSLMSQYTPAFASDCPHRELHRRVTTFEYNAVLEEALKLGFEGYLQSRTSATSDFTPDFSERSFL